MKSKILPRNPIEIPRIYLSNVYFFCKQRYQKLKNILILRWRLSADTDLYNTCDRTQYIQDVKTKSKILPRYSKSKILLRFPRSKTLSRYPRWNPRSYQEIHDVKTTPKIFPRYSKIQDFPKILARYWGCRTLGHERFSNRKHFVTKGPSLW